MVFYFSPDGHDESKPNEWLIYMGKDKFENEDLIKHGWPEDVWVMPVVGDVSWRGMHLSSKQQNAGLCLASSYILRFHVDNLSSAHVYLRLPRGATLDDIPPKTLEDCCQLVKANSIEGCKHNNVDIVYTFWSNLKKTQSMDVGQVGFHNQKAVKKYRVDKKDNDILKRINKTKVELYPDLAAERERYDKEQAALNKKKLQEQKLEEKKRMKEKQEQADLRSYKGLMDEEKMLTNTEIAAKYKNAEEFEDDFM